MAFDKKAYRQGPFKDLAKDKARVDAVKTAIRDLSSGVDPMPALAVIDLPTLFVVDPTWDASALSSHFKEFSPALNALSSNDLGKTLKQLFDALTGRVEDPSFWAALRAGGEEARKKQLGALAAAVKADHPLGVITLDEAVEVGRSMGLGSLPEGELVEALQRAGVRVASPFERPEVTVPVAVQKVLGLAEFRTLAHLLSVGDKKATIAGVRVVDDFARADGRAFGTSDIDSAVLACNQGSSNAMLAGQKALTVIKTDFARPDLLHGLALASAVGRAEELLASGRPRLVVRDQLVSEGWDAVDASRIVGALSVAGPARGAAEPTVELAASRLGAGQLAEAARLLAAVVITDENRAGHAALAAALADVEATKTSRLVEARAAVERGDFEAAARSLRAAMVLDAGDDSLAGQLDALPPPAPSGFVVRPRGRSTVLAWNAVTDTDIRFVVQRSISAPPAHSRDGEVVASNLTDPTAVDESPPVGRTVHYAVFATKDGKLFSPPARVEHTVLPPVLNLDVDADEHQIRIAWASLPDVHSVVITVTRPDGRSESTEGRPSGVIALDRVVLGGRYDVSARSRYRVDDSLRAGPPVDTHVVPRGVIRAVSDLRIDHVDDSTDQRTSLSWSAVDGYDVQVWTFPVAVEVGAGTRVSLDKLAAAGGARLSLREAGRSEGRDRAEVALDDRVQRLVPVTVSGAEGLLGASAIAGTASPPPEVTVLGLGEDARLSWAWGDLDHDYLLEWSEGGAPRRELVTRAKYERAGGHLVRGAHSVVDLRISTVVRKGLDEWVSRPRSVQLGGPSVVHVNYDLVLKRSRFAGGSTAVLTATASGYSGDLQLTGVLKAGGLMPSAPHDGLPLGPLTVTFTDGVAEPQVLPLGKPSSPFWVRFFPTSTHVVLYDPPTTRLKG